MVDGMEVGACECYQGDYEPLKHIGKNEAVVARKDWKCDECTTPISRGTKYHCLEAIDDDGWFTWRRCLPCYRIARDYACGVIGGLKEEIWESLGVDIVTGEIREEDKYWP